MKKNRNKNKLIFFSILVVFVFLFSFVIFFKTFSEDGCINKKEKNREVVFLKEVEDFVEISSKKKNWNINFPSFSCHNSFQRVYLNFLSYRRNELEKYFLLIDYGNFWPFENELNDIEWSKHVHLIVNGKSYKQHQSSKKNQFKNLIKKTIGLYLQISNLNCNSEFLLNEDFLNFNFLYLKKMQDNQNLIIRLDPKWENNKNNKLRLIITEFNYIEFRSSDLDTKWKGKEIENESIIDKILIQFVDKKKNNFLTWDFHNQIPIACFEIIRISCFFAVNKGVIAIIDKDFQTLNMLIEGMKNDPSSVLRSEINSLNFEIESLQTGFMSKLHLKRNSFKASKFDQFIKLQMTELRIKKEAKLGKLTEFYLRNRK